MYKKGRRDVQRMESEIFEKPKIIVVMLGVALI